MKKISVEMFCKTFKVQAKGAEKTFKDFLNKHIVTDYVDILKKSVICQGIVKATCYAKDGDREFVKFNRVGQYIFFIMKLIELYTDIEIDGNRLSDQYDELNKVGAINALISAIPESEYNEFYTILNMCIDDMRDNEYSITALLYNLKQSFSLSEEVISSVLKQLEETKNE